MSVPMVHPIPGFPGYGATEDGRIWSLRKAEPRQLTPSKGSHRPGSQGYLKIGIATANGRKYPLVHSLIAATFLGPKPDGMQTDHRDGDTMNNRVSNLEYVTQSENIKRAFRAGLNRHSVGEDHPMSKLDEEKIQLIRLYYDAGCASCPGLAQAFSVNRHTVLRIVQRRAWTHVS